MVRFRSLVWLWNWRLSLLGGLPIAMLFSFVGTGAAADAEFRQAAYSSPNQPTTREPETKVGQITFSQQPARVGDKVAQTVGIELLIQTTITQAGQQAHQGETSLKRRQQRFVEVLEVNEGKVRRAHVTYPLSRVVAPDPTLAEQGNTAPETVQAVEEKSYFVTRTGDRLLVTDTQGAIPSQAEFEIVVTSLQNLGLPDPLIKFLMSRTVHIGERLQLPHATAQQVMGFGDQFGQVELFELELKTIETIDGQRCAVFACTIEAVGEASNPVRIRAFGQVVIQAETCRTVRAELSGPLSLSTAEHTPEGSFQYLARGNMRLAVQAKYGHAHQ